MVKIAVIGLDGLDFSMLPMLSSLPPNSLKAKLDSLIPFTFPSWSSIMTGVNPGKHGIYGFFRYEKKGSRWIARAVSAYDLQYPRIHEALALAQVPVKSLIIGPLPPYPCLPCKNSDIITITQFSKFNSTSPKILNELYDVEEITEAMNMLRKPNSSTVLLNAALRVVDSHITAIENLDSVTCNYDFLWLYVNLPDTYLHKCPDALIKVNKLLTPLLIKLDTLIKKTMELSENTIIVSDHGFKRFKYVVRINRILYDHGFAKIGRGGAIDIYRDNPNKMGAHSKKITILHPSLMSFIYRISPSHFRRFARSFLLAVEKILHKKIHFSMLPCIDEKASKAFTPIGSSPAIIGYIILLNNGNNVAKEVIEMLKRYHLEAYTANELLDGPYRPSDIIFVLPKDEYLPTAGTTYNDPIEETSRASHTRYGIFVARLEDAQYSENLAEVFPNTVVAPLVLSKLNAPLGVEMDSKDLALRICGKNESEIKCMAYRPMWRIFKRLLAVRSGFYSGVKRSEICRG
mgnify:CR=1 FL=1